jgi:hypothetical protein
VTRRLLLHTSTKNWTKNFLPKFIEAINGLWRKFLESISGTLGQGEGEGSTGHLYWGSIKIHMSMVIIQMLDWVFNPSENCDVGTLNFSGRRTTDI